MSELPANTNSQKLTNSLSSGVRKVIDAADKHDFKVMVVGSLGAIGHAPSLGEMLRPNDIDLLTSDPHKAREVFGEMGLLGKGSGMVDLRLNDTGDPLKGGYSALASTLRYKSLVTQLPPEAFKPVLVEYQGMVFPTVPSETLMSMYSLSDLPRDRSVRESLEDLTSPSPLYEEIKKLLAEFRERKKEAYPYADFWGGMAVSASRFGRRPYIPNSFTSLAEGVIGFCWQVADGVAEQSNKVKEPVLT